MWDELILFKLSEIAKFILMNMDWGVLHNWLSWQICYGIDISHGTEQQIEIEQTENRLG